MVNLYNDAEHNRLYTLYYLAAAGIYVYNVMHMHMHMHWHPFKKSNHCGQAVDYNFSMFWFLPWYIYIVCPTVAS